MALEIKGKTALVTGGGSGICLELTKKLLAGGCNVVIADRQLLPEAKELIKDHGHARCAYATTEVTDWKQLRNAFEKCIQEFGQLDLVVPGAGVFEPTYSNFWQFGNDVAGDTDESSSYKIHDINIAHPIRCTQLALDYFQRQKLGHGVVCHIASIASQLTLMSVPLYCASKAAVAAFVRSLAPLEEAKNYRINAVAPGAVKTPLWSEEQLKWMDEEKDVWVTTIQVADAMMDLITKPEMVGGTVLEVGAEKNRKVEVLNDPGPGEGKGFTVTKVADGFSDALGNLERNYGK